MSDAITLPVRHLFTIEANVGAHRAASDGRADGDPRRRVRQRRHLDQGQQLSGTVAEGAGGDFAVFRPDGTLRLDVRLTLVADNGARLYVTYNGVGTPVGDGSSVSRTAPTFEAPEGPHAWLNNVQAVGIGESNPGHRHAALRPLRSALTRRCGYRRKPARR